MIHMDKDLPLNCLLKVLLMVLLSNHSDECQNKNKNLEGSVGVEENLKGSVGVEENLEGTGYLTSKSVVR